MKFLNPFVWIRLRYASLTTNGESVCPERNEPMRVKSNGCKRQFVPAVIFAIIFSVLSFFIFSSIASTKPHRDIDSSAYLEKAELLYQTGSFFDKDHPSQPYYSLGYPVLIATAWWLLGKTTESILWLQLLLAFLSCLLIMMLARRFWGLRASYIAGFLWSINLGYLVFTQFILTEIALSFCLLLFFERMTAWFFDFQKIKSLFLAFFVLGLSVLIKPAALYFVFSAALFVVLTVRGSAFKKLLQTCAVIMCFYLPVIGYMTHNRIVFGQWQTGTLASVNLYFWFFPNVLAHCNGTTSDYERDRLLVLAGGKHDFKAVAPYFWDYAREKPFTMVYVWMQNMGKTMFGLFASNLKVLVGQNMRGQPLSFFRRTGTLWQRIVSYVTNGTENTWVKVVGLLEALWTIVRLFLIMIALYVFVRRKQWLLLLFCACYVLYFCGITGHDGCARFRMMFEFLLIVLAAGGIDFLIFQTSKHIGVADLHKQIGEYEGASHH